MILNDTEIERILKLETNEEIEFKAILPPSKTIAQLISAFANSRGGQIVLGINDKGPTSKKEIVGLSSDFNANAIVQKAIELLVPQPKIQYGYIYYKGKQLYIIVVSKSEDIIKFENRVFRRIGNKNVSDRDYSLLDIKSNIKLKELNIELLKEEDKLTSSRHSFIYHYQNIIKIFERIIEVMLGDEEKRILLRILFSSCADNFETYLSDLLFEIYLAKPETLKSNEQISVKEVLDCLDMDEFITNFARKKISKLQRGSVRGFIEENKQISALTVITPTDQIEIERILQIRHLYAHRNGIIDEKFRQFFPDTKLGELFQMNISKIAEKLTILASIVRTVDNIAIEKYSLAIYSK